MTLVDFCSFFQPCLLEVCLHLLFDLNLDSNQSVAVLSLHLLHVVFCLSQLVFALPMLKCKPIFVAYEVGNLLPIQRSLLSQSALHEIRSLTQIVLEYSLFLGHASQILSKLLDRRVRSSAYFADHLGKPGRDFCLCRRNLATEIIDFTLENFVALEFLLELRFKLN